MSSRTSPPPSLLAQRVERERLYLSHVFHLHQRWPLPFPALLPHQLVESLACMHSISAARLLHPRRQVHCAPEQLEARHPLAQHPACDVSDVKPDSEAERLTPSSSLGGQHQLRLSHHVHGDRQRSPRPAPPLVDVVVVLQQPRGHDAAVADGLHLEDAVPLAERVEAVEELVQHVHGLDGSNSVGDAREADDVGEDDRDILLLLCVERPPHPPGPSPVSLAPLRAHLPALAHEVEVLRQRRVVVDADFHGARDAAKIVQPLLDVVEGVRAARVGHVLHRLLGAHLRRLPQAGPVSPVMLDAHQNLGRDHGMQEVLTGLVVFFLRLLDPPHEEVRSETSGDVLDQQLVVACQTVHLHEGDVERSHELLPGHEQRSVHNRA
eukprot:762057-Hanusia_phi.AAC.2